jgi:hypothetical protein
MENSCLEVQVLPPLPHLIEGEWANGKAESSKMILINMEDDPQRSVAQS